MERKQLKYFDLSVISHSLPYNNRLNKRIHGHICTRKERTFNKEFAKLKQTKKK